MFRQTWLILPNVISLNEALSTLFIIWYILNLN